MSNYANGEEEDNVAWGILKHLYGLSTDCKDWYKTIRVVPAIEFGGGVTSLDKSVCFWTKKGFEYGYGMGFLGKKYPRI